MAATPSAAKAWSRCRLVLGLLGVGLGDDAGVGLQLLAIDVGEARHQPGHGFVVPARQIGDRGRGGGSMVAAHRPLGYPVLTVTPPTLFYDLPLSAAASVAMALPVLAAGVVSLLTSVW